MGMKYLPTNTPELKQRRKNLRKNQTYAEYLLWQKIRQKQLGIKFYRQFAIGPYILDFYSHQLKLAIELDGGQHNEVSVMKYDEGRSQYLASKEVKILRFWDNEVIKNIEGVLEEIAKYIH